MILSDDPSDDEIYSFVDRWIATLAAGDYRMAFAMTDHDRYYGWSPELIQKSIEGYGLPESHPRGPFRVTSAASAKGSLHREVTRGDDVPSGVVACVCHDLPLNGEWSDLSVTFRFEHHENAVRAVLEEIHVF